MGNERFEFGHHYILLDKKIEQHIEADNNPHNVNKAQVELGKVKNLAPEEMPVSDPQKEYIDKAAGAYLDLVSDQTTGEYTITLYSKDGHQLGQPITINTDNEFGITSVNLDLENKCLVFKRLNASDLTCDITALIDDYNSVVGVESTRAIQRENAIELKIKDEFDKCIKDSHDGFERLLECVQTNKVKIGSCELDETKLMRLLALLDNEETE